VIDLHSHVLPGVDDGAATLEDSVAMARAAAADGVLWLAATPHVRDDYPTDAETMERLVRQVRDAIDEAGVELELLPGGEIALDRLEVLDSDELRRFGLGGNRRYVLIEFPYVGWPRGLEERLIGLRAQGFVPVLAHPERNGEVQADPERLEPLVASGCLVQVTAASLDGRLGRASAGCGRALVDAGLAQLIGSDAHMPHVRAIGMSAAAHSVGSRELAHWLTVDVPRAIVDDETLPERPAGTSRRGLLGRLRRG
jgi:protein-tyrosine phosphatase